MSVPKGTPAGTSSDCGCGGGAAAGCGCGPEFSGVELAADPFTALRVSYGMLLGEADFEVLMGNPRGKSMLHNAWLHGSGLIHGLGVTWTPPSDAKPGILQVAPGLAIDGWGRELRLDALQCLGVLEWASARIQLDPCEGAPGMAASTGGPVDCQRRTLRAWLVAEFGNCLDDPVPALADPCDITRRHDVASRVVETVRLSVQENAPTPPPSYPRVRALLGLACTAAGQLPTCGSAACKDPEHAQSAANDPEVMAALTTVGRAAADDRPCILQMELRRLAALDALELAPAVEEGDVAGLYPVTEEHAGVVLARLEMRICIDGCCLRLEHVDVDLRVRRALLPTSLLQDMAAGLAPGLTVGVTESDAGGPRLVDGSLRWLAEGTRFEFRLTKAAMAESLKNAVEISSLSAENGWAYDEVAGVSVHERGRLVVVHLDRAPAYRTVRIRILGTGPTPVVGRDPRVPFAGLEHGPPGTSDDGHDAVLMTRLPRPEDQDDDENDDDAGRDGS